MSSYQRTHKGTRQSLDGAIVNEIGLSCISRHCTMQGLGVVLSYCLRKLFVSYRVEIYAYGLEVSNRYALLESVDSVEDTWEQFQKYWSQGSI